MNRPYRLSADQHQMRRVPDPAQVRPDTAPTQPERSASMMRKFEITGLDAQGEVKTGSHIVPALPIFEDAAAAFVRGTIFQTDCGPMAVEDLLPGDLILGEGGALHRLMWIGSTNIVPTARGQRDEMRHTWRITADKFGIGRPMPDLVLGPAARLIIDRPAVRTMLGAPRALMPVPDLADDMGLIQLTPPSPVRAYHLALENHALIRAAGLEVESYHPGERLTDRMGQNMLSLYLSLFPHIRTPDDFGPLAAPRVTRDVLDGLSAA